MPSPFPGMNPYLEHEAVWHDFHQSCVPVIRELLVPAVGPNYQVVLDEHVYIHEPPADERRPLGIPDLSVRPEGTGTERGTARDGSVAQAPVTVIFPHNVDIVRDGYVEIRDRDGERIVTVIELLSPSNKKTGADREQYLAKRREVLRSNRHLVELDLLRGGPRLPPDDLPHSDYYALVSRADRRPSVGVWPILLRERLPKIQVPLAAENEQVPLDLQELLHIVYDRAGYASHLYRRTPKPPLNPADAGWAKQFLPQAAR